MKNVSLNDSKSRGNVFIFIAFIAWICLWWLFISVVVCALAAFFFRTFTLTLASSLSVYLIFVAAARCSYSFEFFFFQIFYEFYLRRFFILLLFFFQKMNGLNFLDVISFSKKRKQKQRNRSSGWCTPNTWYINI